MELIETKLLASFVLFVITLICGYMPTRLILNQTIVQYAMFAGGGVLMATAFCHLIPEAHDAYRNTNGAHSHSHSHSHSHAHSHPHSHEHEIDDATMQTTTVMPTTTTTTMMQTLADNMTSLITNSTTIGPLVDTETGILLEPDLISAAANNSTNADVIVDPDSHEIPVSAIPYLEICLCSGFFFMYIIEQLMMRFINTHSHEHPCDSSSGQLVSQSGSQSVASLTTNADQTNTANGSTIGLTTGNNNLDAATTATNLHLEDGFQFNGLESHSVNSNRQAAGHFYKFLRGFLIVAAFLLHSIFEGVSIGSQTSVDKVWTLLFAIGCHKFIIAAVVGLEIYATTLESNLWTFIHMTLFSLMSPIGILLVILAQGTLHVNESDPIMILIQSFATGTVLYIVFVEILQHDKGGKECEQNRLGKSVSLIAGFVFMLSILTLVGHGD